MDHRETGLTRWVEIDLDAISHNIAQVKRLLDPSVMLMAVVKSDGYGHGLIPAAQAALIEGAAMLGVTHPEEGVLLREAGIAAPVLVFRPLLPGEEEIVLRYHLTPSLSDLQQAKRLADAAGRKGRQVPVHIKVETGMSRTGFLPESLIKVGDELFSLKSLYWEGIYTHFAASATDPSFTRLQYKKFYKIVQMLAEKGVSFSIRHVCNSAAFLLYPEMHLDMVRIGTLLYGQLPAGIKDASLDLKDTWSFWTRIIHLQSVQRGSTVGYGRTYRVRKDTTLAVIPVGYSDGFGLDVVPRPAGYLDLAKLLVKITGSFLGMPWGAHHVIINGRFAPVVGRVGMELSCVDVGKIPEVETGTPVFLPARRTVIRSQVPRQYISEKKESL